MDGRTTAPEGNGARRRDGGTGGVRGEAGRVYPWLLRGDARFALEGWVPSSQQGSVVTRCLGAALTPTWAGVTQAL